MFRSIQWFVKNYNSNIHYFTFTWTLVLPPMNKVSDILLVLKMITTLNNKDWWYLVVLKWKVKKKINQSQYTLIFIHILNFISLISEFYHSSFPSEFFFPGYKHSEISYVHSILKISFFFANIIPARIINIKTNKNSRKWILLT